MKETDTQPMEPDVIARLSRVSTATIATQLYKRGYRRCFLDGVKPLHSGTSSFVAPAFTLRNIPMRDDMDDMSILANPQYPQRDAVENTPAGHCLVNDACGNLMAGTIGDILAERLRVRGVSATVTDGAIRDSGDLENIELPIYCASRAAPASVAGLYAVELQVPIGCGGVAIFPGDIMAGDKDGVIVIPRKLVTEISKDAPEQERYERYVRSRVNAGDSITGLYPSSEASLLEYKEWEGE